MVEVIYTVGHSTRSINELVEILKRYKVEAVFDVRRFPSSRRYPHFNKPHLKDALEKHGIKYYWLGDLLGGFRPGGYQAYMKTRDFEEGLNKLLRFSENYSRVALLCRERLWFKCHRRFISDALVARGYKVVHIIELDRTYEHKRKSYENG